MDLLSRTFTRRPSLFLYVALSLCALALWGLRDVQFSESPRELFRSGDETFTELERLYEDFGADDRDCVVLIESEDILSEPNCALIRELDGALAELDGVEEVTSIADLVVRSGLLPKPILPAADATDEERDAARDAIEAHPLGRDQLVDPEFLSTVLFVKLYSGELTVETMNPMIEGMERAIEEAGAPAGTEITLTGIPPLRVAIFGTIKSEQRKLSLLGMILSFGISFLLFRRLGPVLVASLPSLLSGLWAAGIVGWTQIPFDILTAQLPLLVQIIALCDSVHLTNHVLKRRAAGDSPREAAASSLKHLGSACLLTTFTTAVGFLSLVVSRADAIQKFGLLFGVCILAAFFAVVLLVPLFTLVLLRKETGARTTQQEHKVRRVVEACLPALLKTPRLTSFFGLLITGGSCALALSLAPDNRLAESSPEGHPATDALFKIESLYGGMVSATVRVDWPEGLDPAGPEVQSALREASEVLDEVELYRGKLSVIELLPLVPGREPAAGAPDSRVKVLEGLDTEGALASIWRPDLRSALINVRVPDLESSVVEAAQLSVQERLQAISPSYPGFKFLFTGTGVVARSNIDTIIKDLARGLFIAALTIFIALTLFLRSWRLGLLSLIPNILPLSITAAALVLFDEPLQVSSAIAFSVCLGIAVDDTIHFLHRWRRERALCSTAREAAIETSVGVGLPILVTSCILTAGFAALLPSVVATTRTFAWIVIGGIGTAVVADILLLPALLIATDSKKSDDQ
ncbi:MAG: efflux RND transporter permease subunit [Planctomycetes bacterium]|nr:efflux RND transporter permease subunit [Planctomycetota bacterium]